MGLGVVGRHGPLLSPHPRQTCFSPSHSHQEAVLAIGDATTVMGGQVRGGLGKGALHWAGAYFCLGLRLSGSSVDGRKYVSSVIQKGTNKILSTCLKNANS